MTHVSHCSLLLQLGPFEVAAVTDGSIVSAYSPYFNLLCDQYYNIIT